MSTRLNNGIKMIARFYRSILDHSKQSTTRANERIWGFVAAGYQKLKQ